MCNFIQGKVLKLLLEVGCRVVVAGEYPTTVFDALCATSQAVFIVFLLAIHMAWSSLSYFLLVEPTVRDLEAAEEAALAATATATSLPNMHVNSGAAEVALPRSYSRAAEFAPSSAKLPFDNTEGVFRSRKNRLGRQRRPEGPPKRFVSVDPSGGGGGGDGDGFWGPGHPDYLPVYTPPVRPRTEGAWLVDPSTVRSGGGGGGGGGAIPTEESAGFSADAATKFPAAEPPPRPAQRPNILFIMSDDHSAEAVGYRTPFGARLGRHAGTTHIDRLAREGAALEDFFVALSLCSPSRASILTGVRRAPLLARAGRGAEGRDS